MKTSRSSRQSVPGTDLYAVGAVLFKALTGRMVFEGATVLEIDDTEDDAKVIMILNGRLMVIERQRPREFIGKLILLRSGIGLTGRGSKA